jgi:hypothetical protein
MAIVLLAGCSDDSNELTPVIPDSTEEEKGMTIDLSASAPDFVDAENAGDDQNGAREVITKAWAPPSGYYLYDDLYDDHGNRYVNFTDVDLRNKSIDAFFTRATGEEPAASASAFYPYHARLRYMTSTNKWRLSIRKVKTDTIQYGNYYVYGFIPGNAADDATIAKLSGDDYKNGARLTITGLHTAGYDACAIIGAREGFDIDHDGGYTDTNTNGSYDEGTDIRTNRLVAGDFKLYLKKTVDGPEVAEENKVKNYLYLLFDHLGSALSIGIKVDGDYNVLRTIKLKKLALQTATETGLMNVKANVVVELAANNTGTSPISSLSYTPTGAVPAVGDGTEVYQSDEGLTLTTSYQSFLSHFLPIEDVTKVVITCTYDVYDKKNNLLRKDCKATNTIRLSDIISHFLGVQRGWKYAIKMTVVPTYLYVLSDPDLDNPTMVVD